ncbi:PAS domain S-box protein [Undibacterium sp. 5I1]|uniref:ATP-binding protein n=1 Tax=unclassified Undibacterium TaxID=2630295 RepID=UPI002AB55C24|nr:MULTISPECIES: ATP-binding protein [unclassified Undibacterium]MDY7539403.1 PAS domain S-box protein [Undibacterium sp. 5I1]MEB0231350.1 PAS domain S-box protein [Undibacterium sp. 10I3]MEB0258350.1 PAS domain S-box protein [Undibacterium sp. 5I1]
MKSNGKQTSRLAAALGIFLVLTIIVSAVASIWVLRGQEVEKWQKQTEAFSLMLAENTAQQMGTAYLALDNVVERIQDRWTIDSAYLNTHVNTLEFHQVLAEKKKLSPQIDVIFILDADGNLIANSRSFPSVALNGADRDYFVAQKNDASLKEYVSTSTRNKATGQWTFFISRRLTGSDGEFIGIAAIGVSPSFYSSFYEKISIGGRAAVTLFRDDFTFLTRWPERDDLMGKRSLTGSTYQLVHDQKKKSGVIITNTERMADGGKPLMRMAAIQTLDKYPLIINFSIEEELYLTDWRRTSGVIVAVALGGVIAVIMAFTLLLSLLKRREIDLEITKELKRQAEVINRNQATLLQDLTQQKRELKESSDRFLAVFQNAADGIIMVDENGNIETSNPAALAMYGYDPEDVVGKHGEFFTPPDSKDLMALAMSYPEFVSSGMIYLEAERMRKDGSLFPAELSISRYQISGHRKLIVIVRDISERRKMEKMKSEFISTVSHELRTPLTSIRGSLSLLLGGVVGAIPEKAQMLITIAHKNSESLTRLINDLLDSQKIEAGKMDFSFQTLPLRDLLISAVQTNQAFAQNLGVRIALSEEIPAVSVNVDEGRFQQVMANLLSNACKYSPKGADVQLLVKLSGVNKVRVEVIDQGSGIPEDFRERIFQKFSQADSSDTRAKGGTGLGLAITQAIMHQMHGEIGYEGQHAEAGTCFYIELPISSLALPSPMSPSSNSPPTADPASD